MAQGKNVSTTHFVIIAGTSFLLSCLCVIDEMLAIVYKAESALHFEMMEDALRLSCMLKFLLSCENKKCMQSRLFHDLAGFRRLSHHIQSNGNIDIKQKNFTHLQISALKWTLDSVIAHREF